MKLKIFNNKFIKNILIVASGTVMAQIISLLLLPIVTRIFGPEAYGLLGTFQAVISILAPLAALTLPIAIVLPKKNSEAVSIIKLSLIVIGIMVFFITLLLALFFEDVIEVFKVENIANYLYLLPIAILFSGLLEIMSQWLIRTNQYKIIAKSTMYQPILAYGGMILIGFFYPKPEVLIVITVLKVGFTALQMFLFMNNNTENIKIDIKSSLLSSRETLKKYKDFPIYRAPEAIISSASYNIPILMLTSMVNPAAAGFYAIGRTALSLPSHIIGKAFGDVFYPRIANAPNNKESLVKLILNSTVVLLGISFIPFGIVTFAGPQIFTIIFGGDWIKAGEYAQWISIMSLCMFISRPAVKTLPVINAQKFQLVFTIIMTALRSFSLFFGLFVLKNDVIAVALFCCSSSVLYLVLIYLTINKSKKFMKYTY